MFYIDDLHSFVLSGEYYFEPWNNGKWYRRDL